jgi:hypothetical protein
VAALGEKVQEGLAQLIAGKAFHAVDIGIRRWFSNP